MVMQKKFFFLLFPAIICCSLFYFVEEDGTPAKNIILLIGDGMGQAHIDAAIALNGSMNVEKMPVSGFSKTYSANNKITDSGAGATAMATGVKTYNGAIGVDVDSFPVETILEIAEKNGLSTGLISTSSITHATPASFIAHQKSRSKEEAIAEDFLRTDIDLFIGGGRAFFKNRKDGKDLTKDLESDGYSIVYDTIALKNATGKIAALLAENQLPARDSGRMNTLPLSVDKALSILSQNEKGFFLMIEGSQIDWAGHDNNEKYLLSELSDFDKAIGIALEFAKKEGNTLVIVTGDHETGGLTLQHNEKNSNSVRIVFSSKSHTGVMVPVFAFGPGAVNFTGIYENTALFYKMVQAFRFSQNK